MRGTDWLNADPYLVRHAADHAAKAGELDGLVVDVGFLASVDPIHLLPAFRSLTTPKARRIASLYRRALEEIYQADPVERMAILHFTASREDPALVPFLEPPLTPKWRCTWTNWRPTSPHTRVTAHRGAVNCVSLGSVDGQAVVATGGSDGAVRLWDALTGRGVGTPMFGHAGSVEAVAIGAMDGIPVIVSGGNDGRVRLWNGSTRSLIHHQPTRHRSVPSTVGSVAASAAKAMVRATWARATHPLEHLRGEPLSFKRSVTAVQIAAMQISGAASSAALISWRHRNDPSPDEPLTHRGRVNSVSFGEVEGDPVIASGGDDYVVRLWDARTGESLADSLQHGEADAPETVAEQVTEALLNPWLGKRGVTSVSIQTLDGVPVIVSATGNGSMRIWDARTRRVRRTFSWQLGAATSLAFGRIDGNPVIVSGSGYKARVWKARDARRRADPVCSTPTPITCIDLGDVNGDPVIISGGQDGIIRLWDARTGEARKESLSGHDGPIHCLTMGDLDGEALIVSGGRDGTLRFWHVEPGQMSGDSAS